MEDKLNPCYHCESLLVDVQQCRNGKYEAYCFHCGVVGPECNSKEEAIEAWNRRSGEE